MYCLEPVGPASVSEGRLVSRRDGTSAPTNRSTPSRPCRRLDSRVPRHIKCGLGVQGTSRRRGLGAQGTSALLTLLCSPCSARSPLARVQAGPLFLVLFAFQEDERKRFSQSSVSSNFDGRTPPHVHSTHTHTHCRSSGCQGDRGQIPASLLIGSSPVAGRLKAKTPQACAAEGGG